MHSSIYLVVAGLLGASVAASQQQDSTIVETGNPNATPDTLEDQPQEDPLPDWLIDIPADSGQDRPIAQPSPRPVEYVVEDEHVVSQSRMFSVSGGDILRMGAIATHADSLRKRFNRLLGIDDSWKFAISIRLWGNTADAAHANPVRARVRIIGSEPNLQIRIYAGGGVDVERMDAAIVSMLLYEYAMRRMQANALPDQLALPPWLITGVEQALLWRDGRIDRRMYQKLFQKAEMMSPEELVNTQTPETLDAGSRQVYEVSCGVLIMGLLHQEDGPERLRALLADALIQEGSPKEIIATYFHELNLNDTNFSKWWALELAALALPDGMDRLTPIETEKRLADALLLTGMDEESHLPISKNLEDLDEVQKLAHWQQLLRTCLSRLTKLSLNAFPGYEVMISEYQRALTELMKGTPPKEVEKILTPLRDLRRAYREASIRGRDYLDWYEITHLGRGQSSSFDQYADAMRVLRSQDDGASTPISRYLDDIETLHNLESGQDLPEHLKPTSQLRSEQH